MTHDSLEELIDLLNSKASNRVRDRIFLSPLSGRVDFARVWFEEPRGGIANEGSYEIYFIKADAGSYVAAVLDMYSDLHAFTKVAHRAQGHVTRALTEVILPRFWHAGRKTQKVTFEDLEAGERLARKLGFAVVKPGNAEKDLSIYASVPALEPQQRPLSQADFQAMRTDIGRAKLYLKMVKERLELAYGDLGDSAPFLDDLIYQEIGCLDDRILSFMEVRHRNLGFPRP